MRGCAWCRTSTYRSTAPSWKKTPTAPGRQCASTSPIPRAAPWPTRSLLDIKPSRLDETRCRQELATDHRQLLRAGQHLDRHAGRLDLAEAGVVIGERVDGATIQRDAQCGRWDANADIDVAQVCRDLDVV